MPYTSLAVFCGSQKGNNPVYVQHAQELGAFMGKNNITLIYGGGSKGLMGAVADAVMGEGGKVMGIIPEILIGWEHQHTGITDLQIVQDMHSRKKIMYDLCDAAIILPGGFGTLDELFEMLTWNTLKIHEKKVILLNSAGFYDHLIAHINQMQQSAFLYENWTDRILVVNSAEEVIDLFYQNKL
ncbi:TIGR00730 family Rossman fold protein [Aridibaculum aurantiacum]|uniref:LOG family protein n=1 Tax=Aridibaculum aurantiacum TaxID=2810307 RepID=UPI001A960889|nr:TIGR00730 family Rossman fold protein [Aridibaculum aurantiacum]